MKTELWKLAKAIVAMAMFAAIVPASAATPRPFVAADVFRLRHASDIRISPDGRQIAYERASADIAIDGNQHDVMLIDVDTGQERRLAADASTPRWSRDGRRIAYVAQGEAGVAIVVVDPAGGTSTTVLRVPDGVSALEWSPDASRLAFTRFVAEPAPPYRPIVAAPEGARWAAPPRIVTGSPYQQDGEHAATPGHVGLFVVPSSGGTPLRLTAEAIDVDGAPAWTPDGGAILFSAQPADFMRHLYTNARIFRVPTMGGAPRMVSPDGIGARAPAVAPDGTIAFVGARPNGRDYSPGGVYLMRAPRTVARALAPRFDREMGAPVFAADGRALLVAHGNRGSSVVTRFALDGTGRTAVGAIGGDAAFSVADDGTIAYPTGDFARPADVGIVASDGTRRRVTALNEALLGDRALAGIRPLSVRSRLDGASVGAWLVLPPRPAAGHPPLILSIHGGPYGYDDPSWNTEDQLFAAAGYAVLHVNYRGSISYGFAFADRIARDWPNPAYADLMSGVDAAVAAGLADPGRLFVTGGSAGGTLAAWIVGSTDRFRAAAVIKPSINETSDALLTDQFAAADAAVGAFPWKRPLDFWSRSPLSRVGHVVTPTLLMVGEEDHRTPPGEAQQFFDALQLRRVLSELVLFPEAGHDSIFGTPSRLVAGVDLRLGWFSRHGGMSPP